jgi:hypothetical protein
VLRALGGEVVTLLADRFDGGYGLSDPALARVLATVAQEDDGDGGTPIGQLSAHTGPPPSTASQHVCATSQPPNTFPQ